MGKLTWGGIVLRFFLGGGAVVASTLIARKVGGKMGGIFAAFPAVYLAALLTLHLDTAGDVLLARSFALSRGALIGMLANILCAVTAGYVCAKKGWGRGLLIAVSVWLAVSVFILVAMG